MRLCTPRYRRTARAARLPIIIAVVVLSVLASACTASLAAISPLNHPTVIAGATNGALPASVLYTQGPSCQVYKPAAGSLVGMLGAARADGVTLAPEQCYRDYAGQVFWRKYWCDRGLCDNAAVPGTSNHGWAKAVDLRGSLGEVTYTSAAYKWLVVHAGSWGWNQPAGLGEAWHWEWVGDGGTLKAPTIRADLFTWAR